MEKKIVALITGCSSGFGYLTALKFARNGWQTFASVRDFNSEGAKELWAIRSKENLPLELIPIDVNNSLSVEEGIGMVLNKSNRIDLLVNNAGLGYFGPVEDFTVNEVKNQFETNLFGVLRMIKSVAPIMRRQKSGTIINLSSIAGLITFPLYGIYASSKRALEALSEALRFELSHFGIKVVLVEPGSFKTNFDRHRQYSSPTDPANAYGELLGRARVEKPYKRFLPQFVRRGGNPLTVSDLIFEIAQNPHPRLRYLVGGDARLLIFLYKIVPNFVWEYLLHQVYKW